MPKALVVVNMRGVEPEIARILHNRARVRGWTIGRYVAQLVRLHGLLQSAARDNDRVQTVLAGYGLEAITEGEGHDVLDP